MSAIRRLKYKENPAAGGVFDGVDFTIGAEAANVINVAVQFESGESNCFQLCHATIYLSDSADGTSIVAVAPSGGVAIGTNGLILPGNSSVLAAALTALTDLTDSTVGTPGNTLVAMADVSSAFTIADTDIDGTPAHATVETDIKTGVDAAFNATLLPAIRNNFASLAAKVNAIFAIGDTANTKQFEVVSESDGTLDFNITHSGAKTLYVCVITPEGTVIVSSAVTFAA